VPKWGLTAAMRFTEPWGLERRWLEPGKVITDPVHGDIHLTRLEIAIVDSAPFQRLRRVRQLGATHLVYPGATHTRFAHSLGAVKVAQDLMDVVVDQRSGRDATPDLFGQWERELGTLGSDGRYAFLETDLWQFERKIAEVTVLARLGALMHDFGHVPFGHSIEDDLGILTAHDKNDERFDRLWGQLDADVRQALAGADSLEDNLKRLVLSKLADQPPAEYPFVEDIVGNTICADLLDYLRRDHLYTGLPLALGRRYEAGFYVLPDGDPLYQRQLVLRIHRAGAERTDAVTEILKHLRYRYELSERALVHHTKVAADAMIGKALEMWHDALWAESASDAITGGEKGAAEWPAGRELDALEGALVALGIDPADIFAAVGTELDIAMTSRGDDGLLEYLRELPLAARSDQVRHRDTKRRAAVSNLAAAVETRTLYKRIARQSHVRKDRLEFFEEHGYPDARRRLERRAAEFAEIEPAWHILVWLPRPDMRLKVAGVLVDDGHEIRNFGAREEEGQGRGTDIYEAHRNLWAVSVYAHDELARDQHNRELVLVSLAADMDLLLGGLDEQLGPAPYEWPDRMAIKMLEEEVDGIFVEVESSALIASHRDRSQRGRWDARPGIKGLIEEYRQLA
jgi:HD superfamily phosphohydrolase